MVSLYVDGQKVATWAEAEKLFAETASTRVIEFRGSDGRVIATSFPGAEPAPAWEASITREETERRLAEPGFTFEELKSRLGWE